MTQAFVDLSEFNITDVPDAELSLKELKDAVQLSLVQQSEYLRRFALSFSDKVRDEDQEMDKDGLLKQVRDMVGTLKKINSKLSKVFEYHQVNCLETGLVHSRVSRHLFLFNRRWACFPRRNSDLWCSNDIRQSTSFLSVASTRVSLVVASTYRTLSLRYSYVGELSAVTF